jgi:4-amino-4-deoxy-L-arabinose transferase-like glycosyltransferase
MRLTRLDLLLLAALIAVSLIIALPILTYPLGRDQGMYANIARMMLDGGLPFIDMWDIKPPAIYYVYAGGIALLGDGSAAVRALDLVFLPFTLVALYWLTLRITGGRRGAGLLTGVLFTVFYFTETFASLTQSDSLVTLPMTLAVVCVIKAGDAPRGSRRALLWSGVAGALCAAVIWFKHYYALFVLALVIEHLLVRIRHPKSLMRDFPVKEALAFALGGLPVGAIPLLYFVSSGIWAEMLIVAQGTAQYNAQASQSVGAFIGQLWNYVLFRWQHWGVLLVLAALWLPLHFTRRAVPITSNPPNLLNSRWRAIGLWLAAGLAFVLVQAKGFDTHWIPLLPPLTIIAGSALATLIARITAWLPRPASAARLLYAAAVIGLFALLAKDTWVRGLPYLTGVQGERTYYRHFQGNDFKPWESEQVIRYLRRNTVPGDTLYIFGFRPEVYYLTDLRPATRFQAQFPLVADWWLPQWREEVVETLWAALPPYVLVMQADEMPWVTGKHDDSAWLLAHDERLQDLENWLIFNYARVEVIGDFQIWQRKPAA